MPKYTDEELSRWREYYWEIEETGAEFAENTLLVFDRQINYVEERIKNSETATKIQQAMVASLQVMPEYLKSASTLQDIMLNAASDIDWQSLGLETEYEMQS